MADDPSAFPAFKEGEHDELLLEKISRVSEKVDHKYELILQKLAAMEMARIDKADEYKGHFASLNGEAGRILKAIEITVSRDTWEGFLVNHRNWRAEVDKALQGAITDKEFLEFKNSLAKDAAILAKDADTKVGWGKGISAVIAAIVGAVFLAAAVVGIVFAFLK